VTEPDDPDVELPEEVDRNGRSGNDPRSATNFDGVYAEGVPVGIAMAASRYLESRGDYTAQNRFASASGAYQVIDSTWNNFGGYPRAYLAPPQVQDQFAYESFVAILKRYGNDVSKIPVAWYYPAAIGNPALMDIVPMPGAGNTLTPREYQTLWMKKFYELLGEGSPPFLPANDLTQPYIRSIAFPVLGPTWFMNDWGFPRGAHGERRHEGNDLMAEAGQPLRAAVDGTVTRIRYTNEDTAGVVITITDTDGYRYNYFHVNNDTPGTTDNAAPAGLRIHPALQVGTVVQAGQVIAYVGDTGNAVGVPHLHFEIRDRAGNPMNPYPSLLAAQQREQCSVGIGPWSTAFSPAARRQPAAAALRGGVAYTVQGPDGATWEITTSGSVRARGLGAVIAPPPGEDCPVVPTGVYGTGAKGLPLSLLSAEWWEMMRGALVGSRLEVPADEARSTARPGSL
jgi:murein DD-endopeptidase MepM/ murein hydrolase activator NlpD